MEYDNPASRLLTVLKEGKKISRDRPCRNSWSIILNTSEENNALLISRIGKIMGLQQDIIERLQENYPNQGATWQHWSSHVNAAFSNQNLNDKWETFIKYIDDHTVNYLAMSADLLNEKSTIKLLDLEEIDKIRGTVSELISGVVHADVGDGVKKYIIHHLKMILNAIDEYTITGAIPILDAVESTIGHAYLDENYRAFLKETEIGRSILTALAAVANIVTIAVSMPAIAQGILKLTGGG